MPELPEVETVVRELNKSIPQDTSISKIDILETVVIKNDISSIVGKSIKSIKRYGKNIALNLSDNYILHIHLMMSGQIYVLPIEENLPKYSKLVIHLDNNKKIVYADQRKFGQIKYVSKAEFQKTINKLGPEIWNITSSDFSTYIVSKDKYKNKQIKNLLLDQSFIAGVGNIYASEILFMSKVLPSRLVESLSEPEKYLLHKCIKDVLEKAIKNNGTTIKDFRTSTGAYGNNQNYLMVYGKTLCKVCNRDIINIKMGVGSGRSTYFCPYCQK